MAGGCFVKGKPNVRLDESRMIDILPDAPVRQVAEMRQRCGDWSHSDTLL